MTKPKNQPLILVVADSSDNRKILSQILSAEYQVETAENEIQTLAKLPNAVAVIVDLPRPESYKILKVIQTEKELPVVINTVAEDLEGQIKALDEGAAEVLLKPLNPQIVLHRLHNLLNRRKIHPKTSRNKVLEQLLRQSELDEKTGLFTRSSFCRKTAKMLRANPEREYVIIRWDVDRFKVFNDVFGIVAGDQFLAYVGSCYQNKLDKNFLFGHWGADHFVMCIPQETLENNQVIEQIIALVADFNHDFDFKPRIGIYVVEDPELDVALMCDRALLALRSIKDNYSAKSAYYDDSMRAALLEEQEIVGEMDRALELGQFVVYLQPQYNFTARSLHGAEALVRWLHPAKGLIPPGKFIPIFEHNGFISKLDEYVWEQVCRLQRKWLDEGKQVVPISVNISRRDIYNPNLSSIIEGLVQKYQLPTSLLRLEITESAYMENADQLIKTVEKLQAAGFAVEMDDFGSGYSSLNTLKEVPVDMLKLDMKFLADSGDQAKGSSILTSIIRMSHWIKLPVIAEGVESKEQAEYLNSIGCFYMQGYYFAKPMPVQDFEALLHHQAASYQPDQRFSGDIQNAINFLSAANQTTLLFNSFVGGAAIVEYDGHNLEALRLNNKYFEVLGTTRKKYAGKQLHLLDRFDEENRNIFLLAIQKAIDSKEESCCELCSLPLNEQDGEIWTRIRMRLLAANENRYIFYMSVENISRLVKLTEQLTAITDNVPGGIFDFEITDRIRIAYFNDTAASMFGYERKEYNRLFAEMPLAVVHPDDLLLLQIKLKELLSTKEPILEVNYRHKCANGDWRWVRLTGHISSRKENKVWASAILLDIDKVIKNEQMAHNQAKEIERHKISLQTLYDTIPCGIMQFLIFGRHKKAARLLSFNDTAWKILGYQNRRHYAESIRHQSPLKNIYLGDLPDFQKLIENLYQAKAGQKLDHALRIIRADGSICWLQTLSQKLRYADGEEIMQVVFSDITERRQEDLKQSNNAFFVLYDEIFEFDLKNDLCVMRFSKQAGALHIGKYFPFSHYLKVLCERYAHSAEKERILDFYSQFIGHATPRPETLEYRYFNLQGELLRASATVLHLNDSTYLSCNKKSMEIHS